MTHVSEYPAGFQFRAGLGVSTVTPDFDFETYSEAGYYFDYVKQKWHGPPFASQKGKGLGVVGAAVYASHETTDVLSLSYNLKNGTGARVWRPGMPQPLDLLDYLGRGSLIEAWNSGFEWWIWNLVCTRRYGWRPLTIEQMRCAMAKARAFAYPGKLAVAATVMRLAVQKDKDGGRLLDKFSVPRNPTAKDKRLRITLDDDPVDGQKLIDYNVTDIVSEAEAASRCPDLEGEELEFWIADQKINRRGVHVDADSLKACARMVELCLIRYDAEMNQLTGGRVTAASQLPSLKLFLRDCGIYVADGKGTMDDDALGHLLKTPGIHPSAKRAIEIRQMAGSASVKKVFAMVNSLSQWQRLHDLFNYHGARTGRPTGEGPQPTNLPKAGPSVYKCICGRHSGMHRLACGWCGLPKGPDAKKAEWGPDAVEDVLQVIKTGNLSIVEGMFADALLCVSGCLRGLFTAAPGCDLIASDFSSIEGVVTACLAGEEWRVEMFATHGKAYELGVSKITGIPFAEIMAHAGYDDVTRPEWWKHRARKGPHHPMRQTIGKVSELASGFGGWIGAWLRFMADCDPPLVMPEKEIKDGILKWREASPSIVEFWGGQERRHGWDHVTPELFGLEGMAIAAVLTPGTAFPVMRKNGTHSGITFQYDGQILYCVLPSGRALHYHNPVLEPNQRSFGGQYSLSFEGYNTNRLMGPVGWVRMNTYGGKLCENVVQATARDIQRHAMVNSERAGYYIVLHVYDEIVAEVPQGWGSIQGLEDIMGTMPAWAMYNGKPWPIKAAGGWRGLRYRKD